MAAQANPIWALDDAEVKNLAKAIQLFQREFDVPVSDRAVAVGALGSALWFIYGTRLSALYMDAQARRNAAKRSQTGPLPLRPGAGPPPQGSPQPPPPPRPADVVQPGEGFVNGAASYQPNGGTPPPQQPGQPTTLIDPAELARAIANPLPPGGKPN